jgi:uncharacterized phage protein gp47/JayE
MADPVEAGPVYFQTQEELLTRIVSDMQLLVPDLYTGPDGNFRMLAEVHAGVMEGIYLANQIVSDDMFISTANIVALQKHGDQIGELQKTGTKATGQIQFSGAGGTYIPLNSVVSYDPGTGEDPLGFVTTTDGTIPNPGTPTAPTDVVNATAGNLNGFYEYVVTFVTAAGETIQGAISDGANPSNQQINLTNIPLGGPGTTQRKIYRRKSGGAFGLVTTIANNTATAYTDNIADGSVGGPPPTVETAQRITVNAESAEAGAAFNAVPNSITLLTDVPEGITAATNPAAFSGGSDDEDFEEYRARLLRIVRAPETGSPLDVKNWAEEVEGVETATVFSNDNLGAPQNGHVTVRISGPGGTVPLPAVISEVLARLTEEDISNISIHVTTFTPVSTNVTVVLTLATGYTLADVTTAVQQTISDYILNLGAGETLRINWIIDAVIGIPGVLDVAVSVPASNQTTLATEKRIPGTITVS